MIKKKVLYIASTLLLGTLFLVCINVFGGSSDQGADKRNTFMPIKVAYAETLEDINVNMDSLMSEIEQEMKTNPELAMLGSPISFIKQSQAYKNIIGLGLKSVKPLYDKLYESHDAGLYEYILALAIEEITQEEYVYNTEYGWKNSLEFRMCYETKVNNVVFNVEKIINHKNFELFTAMDIYRLIRGKTDRIHTVILTNEEAEILNSNITSTLLKCMETPDIGLAMPYSICNDIFRGLKRKSVMAVGMLSNAGKSRFMIKLIAYIALVMKEKVFVLLNEMTIEEMRYALITTVINNPEFQHLHGLKLKKKEKELTLGLYKDKFGEFIYPNKDEWGDPVETIEEYAQRVSENSDEYNKIMEIAKWIEDETQGMIFAKDVSTAYDDKTLEFEIRKANLTQGINYFFYDTAKSDVDAIGEWAAFKATVTKLTEIAKELDMFGYLSIQLSDDANYVKPDEMTSSQIANAKQIKHILHTLMLFKEINKDEYHKYGYMCDNPDWGDSVVHELDINKRYYCDCIDKNRFGRKTKLIWEVDLDLNIWIEKGELVKK